jgi:hypothetical protein
MAGWPKGREMLTVTITPDFVRRYPDPINFHENSEKFNIEHVIAVCKASELPGEIPLDPNPRNQKTDRSIYRKVKESLLSDSDPSFLLKNKGITLIAHSVEISDDKKSISIKFADGEGIVDGGHTYRIIQESINDCPPNQYVKLEILTGLPKYLNEAIAEGLNTAVQVQQMSLSNLAHKFDWIKDVLSDEPYSSEVIYREGDEGRFDVRDIVGFLTLFNTELFPENSSDHPKVAYISKAKCLELYLSNEESYKKLQPILKDILLLSDYVHLNSHDLYNKKTGGKGRSLAFTQDRKRGEYTFIFANDKGKYRLFDGALYPILAAMRFLVEQKETGNFGWKLDSFDKVLRFYDSVGGDLMNITKNTSGDEGRNPNAIGKNDNHWAYLYQTVAFEFLRRKNQ